MQTANVMVSLGGDRGNTVPKYGVTAAEIAVLEAIHGPGSVHDIEPAEDIERRNRDELVRVKEAYAGPNTSRVVEGLFPGSAARVFENLDELDLPDEAYKPTEREKPKPAAKKVSQTSKKASDKADAKKAPADEDDHDGIEPIKDDHADLLK